MTRFVTRMVLFASGSLLDVIGGALLFAPRHFLEMSDISIGPDPSLLSEIAAPSGVLLMCGTFMILGALQFRFANAALLTGAMVYGSYGLGRLASFMIHGAPSQSLIVAMILELGIAGLLSALRRRIGADTRESTVASSIIEALG